MDHPPTDVTISPPQGDRGEKARLWLGAHGYPGYTPTIRSSDYKVCLSDPFRYYLTRRLGLTQPLSWSNALSRGSWFHKAFELDTFREAPSQTKYAEALADRIEELTVICGDLGIINEGRADILARERHDADTAWAWYMAARQVPVRPQPSAYPHIPEFLSQFEDVGREFTLALNTAKFKSWFLDRGIKPDRWPKVVAQYDMLALGPKGLWIVDLKTTSYPTRDRLSSCPYEFQTQLYVNAFLWAQEFCPDLLPRDLRDKPISGMIHIAVQKPPIKFGQNDRDYDDEPYEITRGPRKGTVEMRRTYRGEPNIENYINRVSDWMLARGDYEHLAAERDALPVVNYSNTPYTLLKSDEQTFVDRLRFLMMHATCEPIPSNFLANDYGHMDQSGLSLWAPFYLSPPDIWPSAIQEIGLIQRFRDEPLMDDFTNE